jgi:hypothetical protein
MTTPVFCSSTGSNTAPYNTWATAATTFAAAIAQASSAGDKIVVDVTNPPADVAAATTWTFLASVAVIASTNSGTATITPTTMGETAWLGSAASFSITVSGAVAVYFYGITFRIGGTSNAAISVNYTNGGSFVFESCLIWLGTTYAGAILNIGASGNGQKTYTKLVNTNFKYGASGHLTRLSGLFDAEGGSVLATGAIPATFIYPFVGFTGAVFNGFDASALGSGTLVAGTTYSAAVVHFVQPKLGSGYIARSAYATPSLSSGEVWIHDGSSGSAQGLFGYYNDFGSIVSDTGVYVTAGAAAQSWKITTTANCSFTTPFVTPWVDQWNSTLTAITPSMEILRTDSTSAYTNADMWGEFTAKVTTGTPESTFYSSRQPLADYLAGTAGTALATGTGTGNWTGAGATPWSGKVDSGASLTPAYAGYLRARLAVAVPSATIYLNPQAA